MQPRCLTGKKMAYLSPRLEISWALSSRYTGEITYIVFWAILTITEGRESNTTSQRTKKKDCSCGLRSCLIFYHLKPSTKPLRIVKTKVTMWTSVRRFNPSYSCHVQPSSPEAESIWQLIGLSEYIVHFTENLMRECILWCNPLTKERQSCECKLVSS